MIKLFYIYWITSQIASPLGKYDYLIDTIPKNIVSIPCPSKSDIEWLLSPQLMVAGTFRNGYASYKINRGFRMGLEKGFLDVEGRMFKDSLAPLNDVLKENQSIQFISPNPYIALNNDYSIPYSAYEKKVNLRFTFESKGDPSRDSFIMINKTNNYVFIPDNRKKLFYNETSLIPTKCPSGLWGYQDNYGNQVIDCVFTAAKFFSNGLAAVKTGGLWGYIKSPINPVLFNDNIKIILSGIDNYYYNEIIPNKIPVLLESSINTFRINREINKNDSLKSTIIINKDFNSNNILNAINSVSFRNIYGNNLLFIYLAGSGHSDNLFTYNSNLMELNPRKRNTINLPELLNLISNINCRKVIIVDSKELDLNLIQEKITIKGKETVIIVANSNEIEAYNNYFVSDFSKQIIRALQGQADFNHDQLITTLELVSFLKLNNNSDYLYIFPSNDRCDIKYNNYVLVHLRN